MTVAFALIILAAPFIVAATAAWAAHRAGVLRFRIDLFAVDPASDYETHRAWRDLDAIRAHFGEHPTAQPSSMRNPPTAWR